MMEMELGSLNGGALSKAQARLSEYKNSHQELVATINVNSPPPHIHCPERGRALTASPVGCAEGEVE
jgi:hypothetical protein